MTRPLRLRIGLLVLASAAACTPAPNILPSNDLNRPTDMTFVCLGAYGTPGTDADGGPTETGPFTVSGRPMRTCHVPTGNDNTVQPQPPGSMHNRTFAFVPNSASGDLSVIDADNWKLVDMDKSTSGYGRVPVGALPEQMSSTTDGCRLMTANRGSCDLTLVDPSALLAGTFAAQYNSATVDISVPAGNGLQRITPRRGDGTPLQSAPYEAVFLPRNTAGLEGNTNLCPGSGAAPAEPYRALVTFPSCDLVALVDLPSGDIVASAKVKRSATPDDMDPAKRIVFEDAGTSPVCPADCGGGRGPSDGGTSDADISDGGTTTDASDDGGASDGGSTMDAGTPPPMPTPAVAGTFGPTSIVIFPRGNQAYVSLSRAPAVLSLALTPATLTTLPNVALNDTSAGSNRIRLSVDPWADPTGDYPGQFVTAEGKNQAYLYVIARDGSLRIIDVSTPGSEQECETNFDPLSEKTKANPATYRADNDCIPYDPANRRPYSVGSTAGLRFPALPVDVAAANLSGTDQEDTVNGGYAWVLTTSGTIYLVNIAPSPRRLKAVVRSDQDTLFTPSDPSKPFVYKDGVPDVADLVNESPPFPNQPRDRNVMSYAVSLDSTLGPTRLDLPPLQVTTGPYIEPLWTMGTEQDATALDVRPRQTYVFFPDRNAAVAQGWDVTWQGTVLGARYSGILNGPLLKDGGGQFCTSGVLTGDIVTLRGCTVNTDCPLGLVCNRDQSTDQVPGGYSVTGLCMSANNIAGDGPKCAPYVSSVRRYEIVKSSETELTLAPHLDEVVRSSLSPCTPTNTGFGGATGTGGMGGAAGAGGAAGTTGGAGGMAGTGGAGTGGTSGAGGAAGTMGAMVDDGCHDPTDNSTTAFACVVYKGEPRCLNACVTSQQCRHGRVCLTTCTVDKDCASGVCDTTTGQCHARPRPVLTCAKNEDCASGACDMNAGRCESVVDPNGCDPPQRNCLAGEACVNGQCEITSFCADGPPLGNDRCFPQLTSYQVNMNAGFLVSGSQAGTFLYGSGRQGPNGCESLFPPDRDSRLASRIPLRPYPGQDLTKAPILCDQPGKPVFPTLKTGPLQKFEEGYFIDRFDPALKPEDDGNGKLTLLSGPDGAAVRQEAPQLVDWMQAWTTDLQAPNACLYMGGPIPTDTIATPAYMPSTDPASRPTRPPHVRARFRNTQVSFLLANIDRAPPSSLALHFDVHGGFRQESVVNLTTAQVSAPARLVLGPVNSVRIDNVPTRPAPFFFVVDQRRLGTGQGGGPTRGQIVRVNPFGLASTNGYLPVYEDYHASNGLFPIQ